MTYQPINNLDFRQGIDASAPPLSPRSQDTMDPNGTWNHIMSGSGYVKPWSGATSQGADTGSRKMVPFGNTWGGIKDIQYVDKTFAQADVNTGADTLTITAHGYQTGTSCQFTVATLPAPLALATTYYLIRVDANTVKVALTLIAALAGSAIDLTTTGTNVTHTVDVINTAITASGSWLQDIGKSRWGIGAGQPSIEGVNVDGFTLSTNLQLQIASSGVYGSPVQAGLAQPSAPGIGILSTVGDMTNSMSAKIARSRPSTGAISLASPTSAVIQPQANRIYLQFPAAATGQTHWRAYFPFQGFGGTGVHYLGPYGLIYDIPEATVAAGTVTVDGATITRALEFNFQDGDLLPAEASFDNYTPPAATHALRLQTVMNLAGCYSDSVTSPTTSSPGTAIAVSKENDYESYVPTSLLFLPEQVVDTLARPIDDYGFIACLNGIHALQYVGPRGDEAPSCTITTVLPDIGIQYPHNWCHFRGKLVIYTTQGSLIMMDESGTFDTEFAGPVTAILRTLSAANTQVGYDPLNDSLIVLSGKRLLVYSFQTPQWRQIWLPDFSVTGTTLSCITAQRKLYFSMNSGIAWTYDTGSATAPLSFTTNPQTSGGSTVNDIYELAIAAQTNIATRLALCLNRNLTKTAFRQIQTISGNTHVTDSEASFTADMVGKSYILFGPDIGLTLGTVLITGTVLAFNSASDITIAASGPAAPQATLSDCLMFVGDWVANITFTKTSFPPNFFPGRTEYRAYQFAAWLQSSGNVGNLLSTELIGDTYPSSRAL